MRKVVQSLAFALHGPVRFCGLIGLLAGGLQAQAQTCNQVVNLNYTDATPDGNRKTGSDALNAATTITYSNYTNLGSAPSADNFLVGASTVLGPGKFLVWQRAVADGNATADRVSVVFTFSRPLSNLSMSFSDIDQDLVNGSFTDRLTIDAFATATGGTAIDLAPGNFSGPGIDNNIQRFVGNGSAATAGSNPAFKVNALTGIASSNAIGTSRVTVSFPSPVQRIVFTYENIAPQDAAGVNREHNMGFETINYCAQADVFAQFTAGPTTALPGASATYTVQFGNNGPDASAVTTRRVTIPAGATVTNAGGGTLNGNVLDFGTATVAAGAGQSFTYTYTLPSTPGVYNATTTATTTTGASQNGLTANDSQSRNTVVTPVTDIATTLSGPTLATQGNLVTLNVTTTNRGTSPSANVAQTVQLVAGLTNVFVSNNGTYNSADGLVTFPALTTLGAGQTVGNTISFAAPATSFAPTAAVTPNSAATGDSNPANNTATLNGATAPANITILPTSATRVANLYTTISPSTLTASPGESVTLTVLTANAGQATAASVVETVQLLPGFSASTLQINGASTGSDANNLFYANGTRYNTVTGLVTFGAISSLASAASQTNSIVLTVPANVGESLLATAFVSSTTNDAAQVIREPVLADNVASTRITVLPTADLAATITAPTSIMLGQPVTYTAVFTNNGPSAAINRTPTVQLPAGLTNVTLSEGSYNAATGLVTFPAVASSPAGTSQLYTIRFTPPATGSYSATAFTGSTTPDPVPANNSASASTTVVPSTDLTVRLSGPATAAFNGPVTFVAQTTNSGPSPSNMVVTTLQLPAGLLPTAVTSSGGTYNPANGLVTFNTPTLANGATASNFATYANSSPAGTPFGSTATVSSTPADSDPTNNSASVSNIASLAATVAGLNDVSTTLTSSVGAGSVSPGVSFNLTATFTSNFAVANNLSGRLHLPPGTVVNSVTGGPNKATFTYTEASGVLVFNETTLQQGNGGTTETYVINVTAPSTAPFRAISAVSTANSEANVGNNVAPVNVNITQPAAPTTYDEVTVISGPATAIAGAVLTYSVQTINNGPGVTPSATQTVTLPAGVTASNISGGGTQTGNVITFPAISNQAAGPAGIVRNTFTVSMPATGSLPLTASVTAAGETSTGNNSSTLTTTPANQVPVAASIINALQSPQGNTAGALPISPLAGADRDGTINGYQLTSIPDATTQGRLFFLDGGALTPITSATQPLTPAQMLTLRFDPVMSFVGNAFFGYTTTDNTGAVSQPALYTIQVGQDVNSVYTFVASGGVAGYQNGDLVASVFDVNGGMYTSAGTINPANDGNGVATASLPTTGPTNNPTNALPAGIAFDPATGNFTVTNRNLLVPGSYPLRITTVDSFGGINTQDIALVVGPRPLPVELASFSVHAVGNADAKLSWRTASEVNNARFVVERSLNGTTFAAIGQMAGQGTKASPTDYTLTDAGIGATAPGLVYYRLQQVDRDGATHFSPVQTVTFSKATKALVTLLPNPVVDEARLDLRQLPAGPYRVSVLDVIGRELLGTSLTGGAAHLLNLRALAHGTYFVVVRGQSVNLVERVVKE